MTDTLTDKQRAGALIRAKHPGPPHGTEAMAVQKALKLQKSFLILLAKYGFESQPENDIETWLVRVSAPGASYDKTVLLGTYKKWRQGSPFRLQDTTQQKTYKPEPALTYDPIEGWIGPLNEESGTHSGALETVAAWFLAGSELLAPAVKRHQG